MKLALSALLLSTAVAMAGPAHAYPLDGPQASAAGEARPHGFHGPHGPMFGPRAAHRVEPITNAPFTAQFTESASFTTRDGKQEQRSATSTVYRDTQGRVREEITLPPPPPRPAQTAASGQAAAPAAPTAPRTMITILDPVAHTVTHLNTERKTAWVQTVPEDFFTRQQQWEERREQGAPQRNGVTHTSLGNKVIAGVSATGESTTRTMPSRDGAPPPSFTRETWFSPDLKLEVSSTETSPRGSHSDTLTNLTRTEPNTALFQVPAGYTTQAAPQHGFGWHHGGPDGFDGLGRSDGPNTPPPPPPPAL